MLKTGKKPFTPDDRDIRFSLLKAELPPVALPKPPDRFGHGLIFKDWLMLGNGPDNTVEQGFLGAGDCVFAGAAHETMETNKLAGKTVHFSGRNVIDDYSAVTGYVIGDDGTDHGTEVREAMRYRKNIGIKDAMAVRHKIGAYCLLDPKSWDDLMTAAYVFSAVGIGFTFPDTAMEQFEDGHVWDVVDGAREEGGHYVPMLGRSSRNIGGCVSWGRRVGMTRSFFETYSDEAWAMVYPEELKKGKTERGMDLAALEAALKALSK